MYKSHKVYGSKETLVYPIISPQHDNKSQISSFNQKKKGQRSWEKNPERHGRVESHRNDISYKILIRKLRL